MENKLVEFYVLSIYNKKHYFSIVVDSEDSSSDIDDIIMKGKEEHDLFQAIDWVIVNTTPTDLEINHEFVVIEKKKEIPAIKKKKTATKKAVVNNVQIETYKEKSYIKREEYAELYYGSGLVAPDGKYYRCGFAEHHNLLEELMRDGTIEVGITGTGSMERYDKLDRNNFHAYPDYNGWFKVRNGKFYYGELNRDEFSPNLYAIKPTKAQIKTICGEITSHFHDKIDINNEIISIFDFVTMCKDAKNGIITNVDNLYNKQLTGNKGYNLALLSRGRSNVPRFFIIPSITIKDLANEFGSDYAKFLEKDILAELQKNYTKNVSVRSSGYISMPGMMDTFLDVEHDQVFKKIEEVCESWYSPRARSYRDLMNISNKPNFAIIIQEMVYGDKDEHSGSGVVLTINPNTGNKEIYGEYKPMCKGDKVMSGKTNVLSISELEKTELEVYKTLLEHSENILYRSFSGKPQEIEFTYESGELFILQTRDFNYVEKKIERIDGTIMTYGTAASPGISQGTLVFDQEDIDNAKGDKIFVAMHTFEKDMPLMSQCQGILTSIGGTLCHAAIAARSMNIPAVTSCGFNIKEKIVYLKSGSKLTTKDKIKINGHTGEILI